MYSIKKVSFIGQICAFALFSLTVFTTQALATTSTDPLLVVLLMVKDEKEVIVKTLQSLMPKDDIVHPNWRSETAYILYDTGPSTDGTQKLAEDYFKHRQVPHFHIIEEPFVNFSVSRNKGLAHARRLYPRSSFILFPDAEWYLHTFDKLLTFCIQEKSKHTAESVALPCYYQITGKYPSQAFIISRLFSTLDDVRFSDEDEIHECPNKISGANAPDDIYFEIGQSKFGVDKSCKRWLSDRVKLLKKHQEHPDWPRPLLYLAMTEKALGNNLAAYTYLKKRAGMSTFAQEDYWTWYNLAEVTELLAEESPDKFNWAEAFTYYEKAHSLRPHRAEPLVQIAKHYFFKEKNYDTSFMYARRAAEKPVPVVTEEMLPIFFNYYEYERWYVLSLCAWYVQEYVLGEEAAKLAIEGNPNCAQLYKNLSFYWERKK